MDATTDDKVVKSDAEWQKQLTPLQFKVARRKGTERAFTGEYCDTHEACAYRCVCCNAELFSSEHKFDSRSGWPSYWQPAKSENVATEEDVSFFMKRTEVHCARCDAHLGHVFDEGDRKSVV